DTVRQFFDRSGKKYIKPIDKKSNYVKRAVGLPGDSLEIIDGKIYINDQPIDLPDRAKPQYSYTGTTNGQGFNRDYLIERYGITDAFAYDANTNRFYIQSLSQEAFERFKNHPNVTSIERMISPAGEKESGIFPNNGKVTWNRDNFGPVYIPKKGETVEMDLETYSLYNRIIEVYEGREIGKDNELSVNGTQVLLNGEPIDTYTFKQDYYWMMGDNRHNSMDSRYWGYVPASHIVGKPVFIWLSLDPNKSGFFNSIRWDRVFTTVKGNEEPVSYLPYFLIILVGIFGYSFFRKKKKKK
ncbi:MAG TPA: signal peptidase I, partial [Salinimicrobium sp.]|nr:signal peptidase I [Salinimicrobium sp.]